MKKSRINIGGLALIHLIIIVFPYTVKFVHHHDDGENQNNYKIDGVSLTKAHYTCPICSFKYLNFITGQEEINTNVYRPESPLNDSQPVRDPQIIVAPYYSLRAPPLINS